MELVVRTVGARLEAVSPALLGLMTLAMAPALRPRIARPTPVRNAVW
jgi:hypothetical protein